MRTLIVLTCLLASAAAFARGPAPLSSLCEEEEPAPPRPVLPCALADSGVLDASCADATFYVVTPAGVLLCQVDVDLIAASSTTLERAPPAAAGTPPSSAVFAALTSGADLPLPLALLRPPHERAALDGPRDGHGRPPIAPS